MDFSILEALIQNCKIGFDNYSIEIRLLLKIKKPSHNICTILKSIKDNTLTLPIYSYAFVYPTVIRLELSCSQPSVVVCCCCFEGRRIVGLSEERY